MAALRKVPPLVGFRHQPHRPFTEQGSLGLLDRSGSNVGAQDANLPLRVVRQAVGNAASGREGFVAGAASRRPDPQGSLAAAGAGLGRTAGQVLLPKPLPLPLVAEQERLVGGDFLQERVPLRISRPEPPQMVVVFGKPTDARFFQTPPHAVRQERLLLRRDANPRPLVDQLGVPRSSSSVTSPAGRPNGAMVSMVAVMVSVNVMVV